MTKQETWNGPAVYQIKAAGRLDSQWTDWFEGVAVESQGRMTVLTGRIIDQSALHGLLAKIRDLGMPIISVRRFEVDSKRSVEDKRQADGGSSRSRIMPRD